MGRVFMVRVFIQARMSSQRFPGKVLAPFNGKPLIAQVIGRLTPVIAADAVVVATSTEPTDDPLAAYVRQLGLAVFRGPLANVFRRFQLCLEAYPCRWFFRICADSPLLQGALVSMVLAHSHRSDLDLVTNVFPRTFPKGQSVEMLRSKTFAALQGDLLTAEEQEHVTKYYYNNSSKFRILNLDSGDPQLGQMSYVVDTIEDIQRLEGMAPDGDLLEASMRRFL
jgi:spore coat polysaccharide biosynthesis protein SpsF (cytidylyltransferase family)